MSENSTFALQCSAAFALETNVIGEVIIVSPFFKLRAIEDKCKPAEALETSISNTIPIAQIFVECRVTTAPDGMMPLMAGYETYPVRPPTVAMGNHAERKA